MDQEQSKAEQLRMAYARVFGAESERNADQKMVWNDMLFRGYINRSTMVPNEKGDVSQMKMECAEGMRIFMLDTMKLVNSISSKSVKKPKIKELKQNERTSI